MILIYTTRLAAKFRITNLVRTQTAEIIVIAQTQEDIAELIKIHRPNKVFLFVPARVGAAIEIQTYVRAVLPHARVRILPSVNSTDQLHPAWQEIVLKAPQASPQTSQNLKEKSRDVVSTYAFCPAHLRKRYKLDVNYPRFLGARPRPITVESNGTRDRTIITDLRYFSLGGNPKRQRPICQDQGHAKVEVDRQRLLAMMRTARRVGTRAEAYRDAVATLDGAETREIVYRTLQGNYRSMVVARDQIASPIVPSRLSPCADL